MERSIVKLMKIAAIQKQDCQLQAIIDEMAKLFSSEEVKKLLIGHIIAHMMHVIDTYRSILMLEDAYAPLETKNNIFDWDMEKFLKRLDSDENVVSALRLEKPQTITIFKSLTDFDNMVGILNIINSGKVDEAIKLLSGCKKLLIIREEISKEYAQNKIINDKLKQKWLAYNVDEKIQLAKNNLMLQENIDRCMDEAVVSDPIYNRYIMNSYKAHFQTLEERHLAKEEQFINDVNAYRLKTNFEDLVHKCIMDTYASQLGELKSQLDDWTLKYDKEYEDKENEIAHLKLSMKSLANSKADHLERIKNFHDDRNRVIEEMQLQEEKERQAIEAKLLAMQLKQNKADGKNKNKNKKKKTK